MSGLEERPPRFVLTGTFHSLNRGDCAMQLAAATALRARWPRARIAIHTPHPDDDRPLYDGLEVVACSRRRPAAGLRALARAMLWRTSGGLAALTDELRSYRDATAVIDLSGDGLTETFGWKCPLSHTVPLLLAWLMKRPFCLMAQTLGPFHTFRPWYRWILGRAAFITARDLETFEYLKAWQLPCPINHTADLAFLLEPSSPDEARQHLADAGSASSPASGPYDPSRPLVGVTPSNLHNVRGAAERGAGRPPQESLRAIAAACSALNRTAGVQIALIPHVFGPGGQYDDRRAAEALADCLRPSLPPLVLRRPLTPPQLKAVIGRCDLFLGMRMHSVIAAVSQAVPTLALAYSPKLVALMNRLTLGRFVMDANTPLAERMPDLAVELWGQRMAIQKMIAEKLSSDILPAAEQNIDILERLLLTKRP